MNKKIPKFKSYKEEAKFWDSHNVTDYLPELKPVKLEYNPKAFKKEVLTIRIQPALKKRVEKIALSLGVNISTLIRIWLVDKLKESKYKKSFRF